MRWMKRVKGVKQIQKTRRSQCMNVRPFLRPGSCSPPLFPRWHRWNLPPPSPIFYSNPPRRFPKKGVYVLFTSPGPLRAVYQALRALLPVGAPVWAQHVDGGKDTLSKLFASARGGWILASEGMEGLYDGDGRAPALAVVARMPLPSMREPWWEAQGENLRAKGRNLRYDLWHPAAALRLKRELAPLRRHEAGAAKEDKESREGLKMVWLLDARASGEGLGAYAARSLGCEPQTAADLAALQAATRAVLF